MYIYQKSNLTYRAEFSIEFTEFSENSVGNTALYCKYIFPVKGGKLFTKSDFSEAYLQLELDEESRVHGD